VTSRLFALKDAPENPFLLAKYDKLRSFRVEGQESGEKAR
jgi:hypothetical protein